MDLHWARRATAAGSGAIAPAMSDTVGSGRLGDGSSQQMASGPDGSDSLKVRLHRGGELMSSL